MTSKFTASESQTVSESEKAGQLSASTQTTSTATAASGSIIVWLSMPVLKVLLYPGTAELRPGSGSAAAVATIVVLRNSLEPSSTSD